MQPLSLYELNNLVRGTLETTFEEGYWLAAELSEVRVAANGHCYVEFVEKDKRGNALIAKARGNIWRGTYNLIAAHFEKETGRRLAAGMKVLVEVAPTFHELYGYSLNVTDIDPTYTMGDLARRRKEILAQLDADGVLTLNKELELPRPLLRIAVISSGTAAGYGDFCDQLAQSGYAFRTCLFSATMQGDGVEQSIIAALNRIADEADAWDTVVIIRGGGAVSDLNGFDTYDLAANVAQFPLPILTGIGHERDDTVIDLVAHTRLKTPTAVAAFLVERQREEVKTLEELERSLLAAAALLLTQEKSRLQHIAHRFEIAASHYIGNERERLLRLGTQMESLTQQKLQAQRALLESLSARLLPTLRQRLDIERQKLGYMEKLLRLAGPERILNMGFSLTLKNGKAVRDVRQLSPGDKVLTRFAQGSIESRVESILTKENP